MRCENTAKSEEIYEACSKGFELFISYSPSAIVLRISHSGGP
jgi:hypothetical protein